MTQIALIEFSDGHFECLYAQMKILHSAGYQVHFIAPKCHLERKAELGVPLTAVPYFATSSFWDELLAVLRVIRYLRKHEIQQVVINTFSGRAVKLFSLLCGSEVQVVAICHETSKLRKGSWKRIIKRATTALVLNDYLVQQNTLEGVRLKSFYPIFFADYPAGSIQKPENELWIGIPGQLEYKRRDYLKLLSMLPDQINAHIKFLLLGNSRHPHGDGADFESRLNGHKGNFIIFREFVPDMLFHQYLKKCDLIMPCLGDNPRYLHSGVSGAFNLAFGYRIPMLIEKPFMAYEDFQVSAFAFSPDSFYPLLVGLLDNRKLINEKKQQISNYSKFSYEAQRERYLECLQSTSPVAQVKISEYT